MPQRREQVIGCTIVIAAILVLSLWAVASRGGSSTTSSASDSSDAWVGVLHDMSGPAHDALYAAQAGNTQGVLTAKTKLAKSCDQAKALGEAGTSRGQTAEQAVRSACSDYGFPLP